MIQSQGRQIYVPHHHQEESLYFDSNKFSLPSIKEFGNQITVSNNFNNGYVHHGISNTTVNMMSGDVTCMSRGYDRTMESWPQTCGGVDSRHTPVDQHNPQHVSSPTSRIQHRNVEPTTVDILNSRIELLETKLNYQEVELRRLLDENQNLKKRKHEIISSSPVESIQSSDPPKKKEKTLSNNSSSTTFSLISQKDFSNKYHGVVTGNMDDFKVYWKSNEYVILNVFCNRDEVFNYFCPLFESKHPNKAYRLVLEREDYRKLFKENKHVERFYRQHAWRISIFTIEFFHFVKNRKNSNN